MIHKSIPFPIMITATPCQGTSYNDGKKIASVICMRRSPRDTIIDDHRAQPLILQSPTPNTIETTEIRMDRRAVLVSCSLSRSKKVPRRNPKVPLEKSMTAKTVSPIGRGILSSLQKNAARETLRPLICAFADNLSLTPSKPRASGQVSTRSREHRGCIVRGYCIGKLKR